MAGPPLNLGGSRVSYAGNSKTVGETKEELLARRDREKGERATQRRRLHAATTVQKIWRGRRDAGRWWRGVMSEWDARFGSMTAAPDALTCADTLLPPLLVGGVARFGPLRTLRALALVLASCASRDASVNWCSRAGDARDDTRARWVHQARRLTALALDATSRRSETGTKEAEALSSCAARLVLCIHTPGTWKFANDEWMSQSERWAMNAVASLLDPRVDAGAGLHAKVCDAASALIRIDDPFATQLCAVALKRMEESLDVSESLDESSDSSPRRVHAAVARVFAVPLLHTRRGEGAARVMDRMASHRVASSSSSSSPMSPIDSLWTLDNILGTATGWTGDASGSRRSVADARRRLSHFASSVGRDVFVDAIVSLIDAVGPGGGLHVKEDEVKDDARRKGAIGCLDETWFALALAGSSDTDTEPTDEGGRVVARLYWRLLRDTNTNGVKGMDSGRMQTLGAVAFAPGLVRVLWSYLSEALPASRELPMADSGPGAGVGVWTAPTLTRGVYDVSDVDVPALGLFCLAYAHLLLVLDDEEFFGKQRPFSLGEQRGICACVNTLVVRTHLSRGRKGLDPTRATAVTSASALLKALRTRDSRKPFAPSGLWLAPASGVNPIPVPMAASALTAHLGYDGNPDLIPDAAAMAVGAGLLVDCPHALTFDYRVEIFRQLVRDDRERAGYRPQAGGVDVANERDNGQHVRPVADVRIRRGRILEDAIAQILPLGPVARGRLAVRYVNAAGGDEAGIDAGGLFKELLADVCHDGFDPQRGVFTSTSVDNYVYPAAAAGDSHEGLTTLELVGTIVGKGMYEGILQEVRLAPFFAKAVLGIERTLDDLPGLDPELHRSLTQVLRYDGDVSDLCLDWTVSEEHLGCVITHELRPNGGSIGVTDETKLAYVHAVADFHLNRRRRDANAAFVTGLSRIIRPGWLRLFGVKELSRLIGGDDDGDVDVDDLKRHTKYSGGYASDSRSVCMFWDVVKHKFTPEERRALLKFVTSSSRPPVQGFRHLHPPFTIHKVRCESTSGGGTGSSIATFFGYGQDVDRLPSASTCFNVLKLPNYRKSATMREKVRYAVTSGAGFELS